MFLFSCEENNQNQQSNQDSLKIETKELTPDEKAKNIKLYSDSLKMNLRNIQNQVFDVGCGKITFHTKNSDIVRIEVQLCIGEACSTELYYFKENKLTYQITNSLVSSTNKEQNNYIHEYFFENEIFLKCKTNQEGVNCEEVSKDIVKRSNELIDLFKNNKVKNFKCK